MFLDIEEFARAVLNKKPSVGLVLWVSKLAVESFKSRLSHALRKVSRNTSLAKINGFTLDSVSFEKILNEKCSSRRNKNTVLLISEIESMAEKAGAILNGYREKLSQLKSVVIVIRENKYRDLADHCPDLMDWIVLPVGHAEQMASPLTLGEVNSSIKKLETQFGMTSKAFAKHWAAGTEHPSDDKWLWNELIAFRTELRRSK